MVHTLCGYESLLRRGRHCLPDALFLTVDVDDVKEVAAKLDVKAMPTFLFIKDGAQVEKLVGANLEEIRRRLDGFVQSIRVYTDGDQVNGIGMCRGDVSVAGYRGYLNSSVYELRKLCLNPKEAIGWYDECMLRFSSRSIFQVREDLPGLCMWNANNASDVDRFNDKLSGLVEGFRASSGDSKLKFAMGNVSIDGFLNLYLYMQCTPDLSQLDCYNCLERARNDIPNCCYVKEGARVFSPSCNLRYEMYTISKSSDASGSTPPPPSAPSSLTPNSAVTPSSPTTPGKDKEERDWKRLARSQFMKMRPVLSSPCSSVFEQSNPPLGTFQRLTN